MVLSRLFRRERPGTEGRGLLEESVSVDTTDRSEGVGGALIFKNSASGPCGVFMLGETVSVLTLENIVCKACDTDLGWEGVSRLGTVGSGVCSTICG